MARFSDIAGKSYEAESMSARRLFEIWHLKNAVAVKVDGELTDSDKVFTTDTTFEILTPESPEGLSVLRHSTAHLMAHAVQRLYPSAKSGIGPSIKDGFYYDIRFPKSISEDALPAIETEMRRISQEKIPLEREEMKKADAVKFFADRGENLKVELIEAINAETVSIYKEGDFADLCRGPHVPHTGCCKFFKLLSVAGAYWHGDEKNEMLTRIYGTAYGSEDELKASLRRLEEAKARDHRKLGRELDLFSIHQEGPGFPFFHPKGAVILNKLVEFWRREHFMHGYSEIKTPIMLDSSLWSRSGHMDHYKENMYFTEIDETEFAVKPMNCPGGIIVYNDAIRSYRELPLRMAELGTVHRHERSGALHGLMRVRCFTQDDAHLYCAPDQVKDEIKGIMGLANHIYHDVFGFKFFVELSTRPENAMGDVERWDLAEKWLSEALKETATEFKLNPGDGAFYGPKIDFHLEDSIGRTWQCGTIQLDFQLPERFDMTYIGNDGAEHRPVMLHRTVLGSLERFIGILIEHFGGAFPYWIAPVQVKILQVSPDFAAYVGTVEQKLREMEIRVEVDRRDEKLGKKIRDAQMQKIPYMLVIGAREVEEESVAVRERSKGDLGSKSLTEFMEMLGAEPDPTAGRC